MKFYDGVVGDHQLTKERMLEGLRLLNEMLVRDQRHATVNIVGGAALALVHDVRPQTDDIDGWVAPENYIQDQIRAVGRKIGIEQWLNEQALMYFPDNKPGKGDWRIFLSLSNLTVQAADPRTLLAMKAFALRNAKDRTDFHYLVDLVGIRSADEVLSLLKEFYRDESIPADKRIAIREEMDAHHRYRE